jgi:hypothetical protein
MKPMTSRIRPALSTAAACGALALLAAAPAQAAQRFEPAVEPIAGAEVAQTNGDHALTVAGNGQATLFWGSNSGMRSALRPAGGPFGPPLPVGAGVGTALPQVASNAAGHTVATWRHSIGGDPEQVWAAIRPAGAAEFGTAFQVSDNSIDTPSVQPDVAVDGSGRALFVWVMRTVDGQANSTRVMHRYVAPDGTPIIAPSFVSGGDNGFPEVVMNEAGAALIGYRSQFDAGPGDPVVVHVDPATDEYDFQTFADGSNFSPALAIDPAGNAIAAYEAGGALHARYRPAGDATDFGPLEVVDGPGSPTGAVVGIDASGNATVAYELVSGGNRSIQAALRPAGDASEFGEPQIVRPVGPANPDHISLGVGADGTALLGWVDDSDLDGPGYAAARPAGAAQFDAPHGPIALQGPVVAATRAAVGGGVGIVSFASRAEAATRFQLDALVYAHEPEPPIKPPSGPGGGGDVANVAPRISQTSLLRKRFRVAGKATARVAAKKRAVKKGTAFRFTLSEAATVRIAIERRTTGRKRGGKCVKPTRALRSAKRCTRFVKTGTLTRRDLAAGKRSVAFSGRIGRKALKPGSYRAVLTATDAGGKTSKPVQVAFRVVR